jgi:hypothetical protein
LTSPSKKWLGRIAIAAAAVLALVAGAKLIVTASLRYFEHASLVRHEAHADGRILTVARTTGDPCGGAQVKLSFQDASGNGHVVTIVEYCPPPLVPGKTIDLIYDRAHPTHAESPTYWSDSDSSIGVVVELSLGFLLLAAVGIAPFIWRVIRRKRERAAGVRPERPAGGLSVPSRDL